MCENLDKSITSQLRQEHNDLDMECVKTDGADKNMVERVSTPSKDIEVASDKLDATQQKPKDITQKERIEKVVEMVKGLSLSELRDLAQRKGLKVAARSNCKTLRKQIKD